MSEPQDNPTPMSPDDKAALDKARRGRNIAIALGLLAFIALVYAVTIIRMGGSVAAERF